MDLLLGKVARDLSAVGAKDLIEEIGVADEGILGITVVS